MLEHLITNFHEGFYLFFHWSNILAILAGVCLGIVIGAVPGLTVTMAVGLALPFTFKMPPITAICFLLGIYKAGIYGGSVSAILIGTPGTPAAAATVMDGYMLAKKGKAGKALDIAIYASVIADSTSDIILILVAAPIAMFALRFGPPEYFALIVFSLTIIGSVAGESLVKGLLSAGIGLLFATVGIEPIYGYTRFSFGSVNMMGGLQFIPLLIGLFAIPEVIKQYHRAKRGETTFQILRTEAARPEDNRVTWPELRSCLKTIFRGGLIGTFIGAIPGIGAAPSSFLSYNEAKRGSKHPEEFGKGSLEGIAAAESGNNGVCGATLIPLLTLGIPGDVITAVMLGAFMIQGLTPGPLLFQEKAAIIYGIFVGMLLCNIVNFAVAKIAIRFFRQITRIKISYLFPVVFILCVIGTYAVNNSMFDVAVMLAVGIMGYFMYRLDIPATPFVIAFILGSMLEKGLRRSLLISKGDWSIFFQRPIAVAFLILTVLSISFLIYRHSKGKRRLPSGEM